MGLFSFIKDAGTNLLGNTAEASVDHGATIKAELAKYEVEGVEVTVSEGSVTLTGEVKNKIVRRKAIAIAGNVQGIESVDDQLTYPVGEDGELARSAEDVSAETQEDLSAEFYTVKSGDTLSGIAGEVYGDVMKYPMIFEANKPMLSDPDKIYPGQKLIIPSMEKG